MKVLISNKNIFARKDKNCEGWYQTRICLLLILQVKLQVREWPFNRSTSTALNFFDLFLWYYTPFKYRTSPVFKWCLIPTVLTPTFKNQANRTKSTIWLYQTSPLFSSLLKSQQLKSLFLKIWLNGELSTDRLPFLSLCSLFSFFLYFFLFFSLLISHLSFSSLFTYLLSFSLSLFSSLFVHLIWFSQELCQDRVSGDVPPNLVQPCYSLLGWLLCDC